MFKRNLKTPLLLRNAGSSLVQALIGAALIALTIVVISSVIDPIQKQQKTLALNSLLSSIKSNILFAIKSSTAWENTVSAPENSGLNSCLNLPPFSPPPQTNCNPNGAARWDITSADPAFSQAYILQLRNIENDPTKTFLPHPVDTTNTGGGSNGLTISGKNCSTFDPVNGNDQCPLQIRLSWMYICKACTYPSARIYVRFVYKPQSNPLGVNVGAYNFNLDKNSPTQDGGLQGIDSLKKSNIDPFSTTSNGTGGVYSVSRVVNKNVFLNPGLLVVAANLESTFPSHISSNYFTHLGQISIVDSGGLTTHCGQESATGYKPESSVRSSFSCSIPILMSGNYVIKLTHSALSKNPTSPIAPTLKKSNLDFFVTNNK